MSQTYDITLRIVYEYQSPAAASRTLLRMLPRNLPEQQLLYGAVTTDPAPDHRIDDHDFFGNPCTELAHERRLTEIDFLFRGRVLRREPARGLDLSCAVGDVPRELSQIASIAPESPHHFLGASPRLPQAPEIAEFVRGCVTPGLSALAAVDAVSAALHETFSFDPGATEVSTTPIEAFRARRGVCQDISHVMITGLRALGIPAGYVSGFLRTLPPEGEARLEGPMPCMPGCGRGAGPRPAGSSSIRPTPSAPAPITSPSPSGGTIPTWPRSRGSLRSSGSHKTTHHVDVVPV